MGSAAARRCGSASGLGRLGTTRHPGALRYCTAAVEHAEAYNNVLAEAGVDFATYIELYSVGRRPDLAAALALAEFDPRTGAVRSVGQLHGIAELHVAEASPAGEIGAAAGARPG